MTDYSAVSFFTERHRSKRISAIVDQTFHRLKESTQEIDALIPLATYADINILLLTIKNKPTIAQIVGNGQDLNPTNPQPELSEFRYSEIKLAKARLFVDEDYKLMQSLRTSFADNSNSQYVTQLEEYFFGIPAALTVAIVQKHLMLTLQSCCYGSVDYTDPLTEGKFKITYPQTIASLLPAALTGNNRWNQPTTAAGLDNLRTHGRSYYDEFGMFPTRLLMHYSNFEELRAQTATKQAYVAQMGGDATAVTAVDVPHEALIEMVRRRVSPTNGAFTLQFFDSEYHEDTKSGTSAKTPYLPLDYYCFIEPGNVERAIVPCVENNFVAGVFTETKVIETIPKRERMAAIAAGIPLIKDSRMIAARKVN